MKQSSEKGRLLSSDVLEQQFGRTAFEVLSPPEKPRLIRTRACLSGHVLELSRVRFMPVGIHEFPEIHEEVMKGQSMGKTFRGAGIDFFRDEEAAYRHSMPESFRRQFGSNEPATVVAVTACVGSAGVPYAHILEVYHPGVEWREHGDPPAGHLRVIELFDKELQQLAAR